MMPLNFQLLNTEELNLRDGQSNPMGSYNPMQFVLRLRKDIHQALNQVIPGVQELGANSNEQQQAFSTYLHETIHWWQYVGSNFGFISSLRFPSQSHRVWPDLKEVAQTFGCFKSIEEYHDTLRSKVENDDPKINRILNFWYDLEGGGAVSFDPTVIKYFLESPFYVSVGHSAYILYSSAINCIASIIDPELHFLPKASTWGAEFRKLEDEGVIWYDPEPSTVILPEFGTKAIFEGQARICQLQYLYFSSAGRYQFAEFRSQGLLSGIYIVALEHFLKTLEEPLPATPHDPLIGLFLLVC